MMPSLPEIPIGISSTLLQRCPGLAIAERQMAATNAASSVAFAAYYPAKSLFVADAFSQSPLAGLLQVSNHA